MASIGSILNTVGTSNPTAAASAGSPSSSSSASTAGGLANESTFLQLLVTQIKNQDPTQPMDSSTFLTQLAQFSSLEQLVSINQDLQKSSSATAPAPTTSTTGS